MLLEHGAQLVPVLEEAEVSSLTAQLAKHRQQGSRSLRPSEGNGCEGQYATLCSPLPTLLQRVMDATREWISKRSRAGRQQQRLQPAFADA